jgi:uncharacterized protein YydD (DUF2326 family)
MILKSELITTKAVLEKRMAVKVIELSHDPLEPSFYHILCNEIRSLAAELIRLSYEIDNYDHLESMEEAKDESK